MYPVLVPLLIALFFFFVTTLIILHNRKYFQGLLPVPDLSTTPLVSILIPARNEEDNIGKLLDSLKRQDYPNMEIFILDDGSEDRTREIAEWHGRGSVHPVCVHTGKKKPDDWLGKNWACHQLSIRANGKVLIFLDADTWMTDSCISSTVGRMQQYNLHFTTVWPHQIMESISERTVLPVVYATIVTYLPTEYSYRAPRWIPFRSLREKTRPMFAGACGQCLAFTSHAYSVIGGHESVKKEIVEDVMLSRKIAGAGLTMRMFHGTDQLWCRMYHSHTEIFSGLRKNFFAGFGNRFLPFIAAWVLHILVYLVPPVLLVLLMAGIADVADRSMYTGLAVAATVLPFLQRLWVCRFLKWPWITALLHLPGILWFQMLAAVVIYDYLVGTRVTWKGRAL